MDLFDVVAVNVSCTDRPLGAVRLVCQKASREEVGWLQAAMYRRQKRSRGGHERFEIVEHGKLKDGEAWLDPSVPWEDEE